MRCRRHAWRHPRRIASCWPERCCSEGLRPGLPFQVRFWRRCSICGVWFLLCKVPLSEFVYHWKTKSFREVLRVLLPNRWAKHTMRFPNLGKVYIYWEAHSYRLGYTTRSYSGSRTHYLILFFLYERILTLDSISRIKSSIALIEPHVPDSWP